MSRREDILAAFKTVLTGLAGGRVYRSRKEQIPDLPAIVIEPARVSMMEQPIGISDQSLTVAVQVLAKGDVPDSAADTTLSSIHAAVMADITLGLGSDVQVSQDVEIEWDLEEFDHVRAILLYRVRYRTAIGAL